LLSGGKDRCKPSHGPSCYAPFWPDSYWPARQCTSQATSSSALQPGADKPDFRGTDGSNSGQASGTGPAALPSQVFAAQPPGKLAAAGVELA
jgi:hypothetical protein